MTDDAAKTLAAKATSKALWRRRLLEQRQALPAAEHASRSLRLCQQLAVWLSSQAATDILLFLPIRGEPDLMPLASLCGTVRLALPVVHDQTQKEMTFYQWRLGNPLIANRWGIPEPDPRQAPPVPLTAQAIVLTPCLAVDRRGVRLGYGGGYYDRFFATAPAGIRAVGVVFSEYFVDDLPATPLDMRVGWVATDQEVRQIGA